MDPDVQRGERLVAKCLIAIAALAIASTWLQISASGLTLSALGRSLVTVLTLYMTWFGRRWARLLLGLFVVPGALVLVLTSLASGRISFFSVLFVAMGATYLALYAILIRSRDARAFFNAQASAVVAPPSQGT